MFIKVKNFIVNTDHITHAEWRRLAAGSPSETRELTLYFATSTRHGSLVLREDEEVRNLWGYLEERCTVYKDSNSGSPGVGERF